MEYVQIAQKSELPDITKLKPFRCIVVVEDEIADSRQKEISAWLVNSGCLYMMAWGKGCESWDTSVDMANLEQFDFNEVPDESFVSTTWHDDETLSEVFWYSKHCAFHSEVDLENTLVLHLSSIDKCMEYSAEYKNA